MPAEASLKPGQVLRNVGGLAGRSPDALEGGKQTKKAAKIRIEAELVDDGIVHESKFDLPDPAAK